MHGCAVVVVAGLQAGLRKNDQGPNTVYWFAVVGDNDGRMNGSIACQRFVRLKVTQSRTFLPKTKLTRPEALHGIIRVCRSLVSHSCSLSVNAWSTSTWGVLCPGFATARGPSAIKWTTGSIIMTGWQSSRWETCCCCWCPVAACSFHNRALSQPLAQATGGFNPYRNHSTISLRLQLTQGPLATHTNTAQQQSAHTMNQPQLTNLQCHKQSNRRLNWTQKTTCSLGCDQKQESSCQGELSTPVRMSLCGCCYGLHLEEPWCSSKHGSFSSVLRSRVIHLLLLPESTHKHSADCLCVLLQVCQGSAIHHRQLQGTE